MELFADQITSATMIAYLIQYLKNSGWFPLISPNYTRYAQRAFAGFVALITTIGVHYTFDTTAATADTIGNVIISIPTFSVIFHSLWEFGKQFLFQELAYKKLIKQDESTV